MTALLIIETQSGNVSMYILTNVIYITDGQILLTVDLVNIKIRSAINVEISISKVESTIQIKTMKQIADKSKLKYFMIILSFYNFDQLHSLKQRKYNV